MSNLMMISKVKNEADIIETFLRYHSQIFDEMIIIDNGSVDGTYEIICELIREGLNIVLVNEGYSEFDEFRFINQYTKKYTSVYKPDYIAFLDADEFIFCVDNSDVRKAIINLDKNSIHFVSWRTYLCSNSNERIREFEFNDFLEYRNENKEIFKKIIVPGNLYIEKKIIIDNGNHNYSSKEKIANKEENNLKLAHFPIRSIDQYKRKVILNMINQSSYIDSGKQTGAHWRKMFLEDCHDKNVGEISRQYAFYKENDMVVGAFNNEISKSIKLRYDKLIEMEIERIYEKFMQIQALKLKYEKLVDKDILYRKKILVYGTGNECKSMLDKIDKNRYDIEVFADSDEKKLFDTFLNKVIIGPELMRFFDFSTIVIASKKYEGEIREQIQKTLPYWNMDEVKEITEFIVEQY